jgi:hypothetical protein
MRKIGSFAWKTRYWVSYVGVMGATLVPRSTCSNGAKDLVRFARRPCAGVLVFLICHRAAKALLASTLCTVNRPDDASSQAAKPRFLPPVNRAGSRKSAEGDFFQ